MELTHTQAIELINTRLDFPLDTDLVKQLQNHLALCAECHTYATMLGEVDASLRTELTSRWPDAKLSASEHKEHIANVYSRIRRKQTAQRQKNVFRSIAWGTAAILLIVFFAWTVGNTRPQPAVVETTPTIYSTPTSLSSPQPTQVTVPIEWVDYSSSELGIRLRYPSGWTPSPQHRIDRPDGFLQLSPFDGAEDLFQACQYSLMIGDSTYYGLQPTLTYPEIDGQSACRVEPSADQKRNNNLHASLYVVKFPIEMGMNRYLQLIADRDHIDLIAASLQFIIPGVTPTQTPNPGITRYTSPTLPITIDYPSSWSTQRGPDEIGGNDGYFKLAKEDWNSTNLTRLCEARANDGNWGIYPKITLTAVGDRPACIVYASLERSQGNGAMLIVQSSQWDPQLAYYSLVSDPPHFDAIAASFQLNEPVPPQPTQPSGNGIQTPDPASIPTDIPPVESSALGLTIEEYPIVDEVVDSPGHFEFNQRIPAPVLARRQSWLGFISSQKTFRETNQALQPFGYELKTTNTGGSDSRYSLNQGGILVKENITSWRPISVNYSGTDFALQFEVFNGSTWLARKDSLKDWDVSGSMFIPPVFVGDNLTWVRWESEYQKVNLEQDAGTLYSFTALFMVKDPVEKLASYEGHWVLEVDGFLIEDGENLNTKYGYDEAFGFDVLAGKPFYFFKKDGKVQVSYGGENLPVTYDAVMHYACCEPAMFNAAANESMTWFYALKDHTWYYVEIGSYNNQ